jgi:hypothetical protein
MGAMPNQREQGRPSPEARYANFFQIGHRLFEFYLEFGQVQDEEAEPRIHTRIVTSPARIKALLEVLRQSTESYEKEFGFIDDA